MHVLLFLLYYAYLSLGFAIYMRLNRRFAFHFTLFCYGYTKYYVIGFSSRVHFGLTFTFMFMFMFYGSVLIALFAAKWV